MKKLIEKWNTLTPTGKVVVALCIAGLVLSGGAAVSSGDLQVILVGLVELL